jgi:hypothetical protein
MTREIAPRLRLAPAVRQAPVMIQRSELEQVPVRRDWLRRDPHPGVAMPWDERAGWALIAFALVYIVAQLVRAVIAGTL